MIEVSGVAASADVVSPCMFTPCASTPCMPRMPRTMAITAGASRAGRTRSGVRGRMRMLVTLRSYGASVATSVQVLRTQSQGVADDADRRQRHRGGGDDRGEQHARERVQDTRGDRDAGCVVDEREHQVLP